MIIKCGLTIIIFSFIKYKKVNKNVLLVYGGKVFIFIIYTGWMQKFIKIKRKLLTENVTTTLNEPFKTNFFELFIYTIGLECNLIFFFSLSWNECKRIIMLTENGILGNEILFFNVNSFIYFFGGGRVLQCCLMIERKTYKNAVKEW